jgi:hypothetical protein
MQDAASKPTRYMRMDQMSLDDSVAVVQIIAPDRMTAAELEDVREVFAIKLRQWERSRLVPSEPSADAAVKDVSQAREQDQQTAQAAGSTQPAQRGTT